MTGTSFAFAHAFTRRANRPAIRIRCVSSSCSSEPSCSRRRQVRNPPGYARAESRRSARSGPRSHRSRPAGPRTARRSHRPPADRTDQPRLTSAGLPRRGHSFRAKSQTERRVLTQIGKRLVRPKGPQQLFGAHWLAARRPMVIRAAAERALDTLGTVSYELDVAAPLDGSLQAADQVAVPRLVDVDAVRPEVNARSVAAVVFATARSGVLYDLQLR